jgi:hypothetical protein
MWSIRAHERRRLASAFVSNFSTPREATTVGGALERVRKMRAGGTRTGPIVFLTGAAGRRLSHDVPTFTASSVGARERRLSDGQAVQGGGLLEASSRRHRVLYRAWRRQACQKEGLPKAATGRKQFCCARRRQALQEEGCTKHDQGRGYCKAHGGGRRCKHEGCPKAARPGSTQHRQAHGGGKHCQRDDCFEIAAKCPGSTLCPQCLRGTQS